MGITGLLPRAAWRPELAVPFLLVLAACEAGEGMGGSAPVVDSEDTELEPVVIAPPPPPEPPKGAMIVRIPAASRADIPAGAIGTIELAGELGVFSAEANQETRLVAFEEVPLGTYDLNVTFVSEGVEIGGYSYPIQVVNDAGDITAPVSILRGNLVVEAVVRSTLNRTYTGVASMTPGACIGAGAMDAVRSELAIVVNQSEMELAIANFGGQELQLSGNIVDGSEPIAAAGEFRSSDGSTGGWNLVDLRAPTPRSISARVEFDNETSGCRSTLEFAGLVDPPTSMATRGSNLATATVAAIGHGQRWTETLMGSDMTVQFDELLIGPYEIQINVDRGGQMSDTFRDSVVLDVDGSTVTTEFNYDLALGAVEQAPAAVDRGLLNQVFQGGSIVLNGAHDCIGSVALIDTTSLTASAADDGSLEWTFDNFYGQVLELAGSLDDSSANLAAEGTWRSSDASSGTWTLDYIGMPSETLLAMQVGFINQSSACSATYEFSGIR